MSNEVVYFEKKLVLKVTVKSVTSPTIYPNNNLCHSICFYTREWSTIPPTKRYVIDSKLESKNQPSI